MDQNKTPFDGLQSPQEVNSHRTHRRKMIMPYSDNQATNALVNVLQPDMEDTSTEQGPKGERKLNESVMNKVMTRAKLTGSAINDNQVVLETQPDIKRIQSLIVNGVLSPNDTIPHPMRYRIEDPDFPSKELLSDVKDYVEDYYRNKHKIDARLEPWLSKILFTHGSVPIVKLPQVSLNAIINPEDTHVSLEAMGEMFDSNLGTKLLGAVAPLDLMGAVRNIAPSIESQWEGPKGSAFESFEAAWHLKDDQGKDTSRKYTPDPRTLAAHGIGLEDYNALIKGHTEEYNPFNISITDNPDILALPIIGRSMRAARTAEKYASYYGRSISASLEAADIDVGDGVAPDDVRSKNKHTIVDTLRNEVKEHGKEFSDTEIYNRVFKRRNYSYDAVKTVRTQADLNKPTVGHGIELELSSESVFVVHQPGAPDKHTGYLVLIEGNGAPIVLTDMTDNFTEMSAKARQSTNAMGSILQNAYANMTQDMNPTGTSSQSIITPQDMDRIYSTIVEKAILESLKAGINGEEVAIAIPEDAMRLMLYRSLKGQHTRILYIPAEMMTYMANDYDYNGIGVSLLHAVRIYASLRTIMLFAQVNGEIKNSIAATRLIITLDDEDPAPEVTVEQCLHHLVEMRSSAYATGGRPSSIQHMLAAASVDVTVDGGNNMGWPGTKIETEDTSRNVHTPSEELDNRLQKMIYSGIGGIPPELVNQSDEVEFAATYIGSNTQLTKLVMGIQDRILPHFSNYIRNDLVASSIHMSKLLTMVKKAKASGKLTGNWKDHDDIDIVMHLINRIECELPRPKLATAKTQLASIQEYEELVERVLMFVFDPDVLSSTEFGEKIGEVSGEIRAKFKAHLMRDFMRQNSVLPELFDLVDFQDNEELTQFVTQTGAYNERVSKLLRVVLKSAARTAAINDREQDKIVSADDNFGGGSDYGSDDEGGGGGDDFGFDMGGDDFGLGGDDEGGAGDDDEPSDNTGVPEDNE